MTVEAIKKPFAPDEIPVTLRRIADEIEAGEFGLKTTCIVVLGHTDERPMADGNKEHGSYHQVFGIGPRADPLTVRGLLMMAAIKLGDD